MELDHDDSDGDLL